MKVDATWCLEFGKFPFPATEWSPPEDKAPTPTCPAGADQPSQEPAQAVQAGAATTPDPKRRLHIPGTSQRLAEAPGVEAPSGAAGVQAKDSCRPPSAGAGGNPPPSAASGVEAPSQAAGEDGTDACRPQAVAPVPVVMAAGDVGHLPFKAFRLLAASRTELGSYKLEPKALDGGTFGDVHRGSSWEIRGICRCQDMFFASSDLQLPKQTLQLKKQYLELKINTYNSNSKSYNTQNNKTTTSTTHTHQTFSSKKQNLHLKKQSLGPNQ